MQDDLFNAPAPLPATPPNGRKRVSDVLAITPSSTLLELARSLPSQLRMGVSTWSYPGWEGLVWDGSYDTSMLSRKGLTALSQHPLMRTVCVDRTFWRPLSTEQYAQMASQVPEDFRFMVKCPNIITDALVRGEDGQGQQRNPVFLNPQLALDQFVFPALQGLGHKLGVLVFQLSPLPWDMLHQPAIVLEQLSGLLHACSHALEQAKTSSAIIAVEVRDPLLLDDGLIQTLQAHNATLCLGLHGKMPSIDEQLPFLRKLWPTPLICRWNLNASFGPFGYAAAQEKHQPLNAIQSPDVHTRTVLARVIQGITGAGQAAFITISNDAEGCAPLSIQLLAQQMQAVSPSP